MREPSFWTDERVEELKTRWANNETGTEIYHAMGARSRNAVVGKVYRLKLSFRATKHAKPGNSAKRRIRKTVHYVDGRVFIVKGEAMIEDPIPAFTNPKRLMELKDAHCRWPGSGAGAEMLYCGAPVLDGQSYCAAHYAIAHDGKPRVRAPWR